jgi:hypothetical protein
MADPITGLLLQLLGAVTAYAQEKRYQGDKATAEELEDFKEFIQAKDMQLLVDLLDRNAGIGVSVKAALHQDRQVQAEQYKFIESQLALLCQGQGALSGIAEAIHPGSTFSPVAKKILQRFADGKAQTMLPHIHYGGMTLVFTGGTGGNIELDEEQRQFIDDDIRTLLGQGLIIHGLTSKGKAKYTLTRDGQGLWQRIAAADDSV